MNDNEKVDGFLARLYWVLADQDKYPWCDRIGVGAGRGNTMFGTRGKPGAPPTADGLNAIGRYENVSMNWLLDGKGPPCMVTVVATDDEGAQWVAHLAAQGRWEWCVVNDRQRLVLVLLRPDRYQVKERTVDYTHVEILSGALGGRTLRQVRACGDPVSVVEVDAHTLQELADGKLSNRRLLRAGDGVLTSRQPLAPDASLWEWPEAASQPLSPEEEELLQAFRAMDGGRRTLFLAVAEAFAGQTAQAT